MAVLTLSTKATAKAEDPNVFVYPSNPSYGWDTLSPLVPRPKTTDLSVPHDSHYYGVNFLPLCCELTVF